jgi:hypothetical protein
LQLIEGAGLGHGKELEGGIRRARLVAALCGCESAARARLRLRRQMRGPFEERGRRREAPARLRSAG